MAAEDIVVVIRPAWGVEGIDGIGDTDRRSSSATADADTDWGYAQSFPSLRYYSLPPAAADAPVGGGRLDASLLRLLVVADGARALVIRAGVTPHAPRLALLYGQFMRRQPHCHVIFPQHADIVSDEFAAALHELRAIGFVEVEDMRACLSDSFASRHLDVSAESSASFDMYAAYSCWRSDTPPDLRPAIESPADGDIIASTAVANAMADIDIKIRIPSAAVLSELLPERAAITVVIDGEFGSPTANTEDHAVITPGDAARGFLIVRASNVNVGSHTLTVRMAFSDGNGDFTPLPHSQSGVAFEVVSNELMATVDPRRKHTEAAAAAAADNVFVPLAASDDDDGGGGEITVAFLDNHATLHVDGQRKIFLQQARGLGAVGRFAPLVYVTLVSPLRWASVEAATAAMAESPFGREIAALEAAGRARAVWAMEPSSPRAILECASSEGVEGRRPRWTAMRRCLETAVPADLPATDTLFNTLKEIALDVAVVSNTKIETDSYLAVIASCASRTGEAPVVLELPLVDPSPRCAAHYDLLVAPSHHVARHPSVQSLKLRTAVINPGIDVDSFAAAAAAANELGAEARRREIVFVGRLDPDKSPGLFIRACAVVVRRAIQAHAAQPLPKCRLIGDGSLRPAMERLADEMGLAGHLFFDGAVLADEIPAALAKAAVFVSTSTFGETFGLALLEAAAAGLPVVCFAQAGMREFAVPGQNVIVPELPTPISIADAIWALLSDAELSRRMAASLRETARERFDAATTNRKYAAVYRGLVPAA